MSQDEPVEVPYLKAAENGDVNAQFFLAYLYADGGFNVEHDEEKSRHWYLKAAEQGHAEAQKICHQINQKFKISNSQYWLQWIDKGLDYEVLLELEENAADSLRDDKDFILNATKKNASSFRICVRSPEK